MSRNSGRQICLEGRKNVIWSNNGGWSGERIYIGNWDLRIHDSQNSVMRCRSSSRQAIGDELALMERRSPRARVYTGRSKTGGVGGGVEITKDDNEAAGVLGMVGTFEVDEYLRTGNNTLR